MSKWVNDETDLTPDEWDRCLMVLTVAIRNHRRLSDVRAYFEGRDGSAGR